MKSSGLSESPMAKALGTGGSSWLPLAWRSVTCTQQAEQIAFKQAYFLYRVMQWERMENTDRVQFFPLLEWFLI